MTWTKLSDDFSDDCWTLSDKAFRLHVEGLVWNNRKLVDLYLDAEDVRRFAKHPEAVVELLAVGWWSAVESGYVINHHATYQRSRDAVLKQQAANEENGRKGGRPPKAGRERVTPPPTSGTQSVSESVSERVTHGTAPDSVPSSSSTLRRTQSLSESKSERDGPGLASGWEATEGRHFDDPWADHPVTVPGQGVRPHQEPKQSLECMACVWGSKDGHRQGCVAA